MPLRPAFDLDLLRTLVFVADEASFTKAAKRVGRTQSAVTLQIQKLESLVRQPLLTRSKGGRVELTAQGQVLVERARTLLELNDDAFRALSGSTRPSKLRLGVPTYCIPFFLPQTMEALRSHYPDLLIEVIPGFSCQLVPQIEDGGFDLIMSEESVVPRDAQSTLVWRGPLKWITSMTQDTHKCDPLPLCLFPSDCPWRPAWLNECHWRGAALQALARDRKPHRVVAIANTIEGLYASVAAGEAVTVSLEGRLPAGVRAVGDDEGLPALPDTGVVVLKGRNATQPLTNSVIEIIVSHFSVE